MRRALAILACMIPGGFSAYYGQPYMRGNSDAVTIIITVMTVFAGFLVGIMAVVGDPALIPEESWRDVEHRREAIDNRLIRYLWLFVFYLLAIGFLFVGALLDKAPEAVVSNVWKIWIERAYLFFGATSFLFTFGLPKAIWKLQIERLDAETRRRRQKVGLKD